MDTPAPFLPSLKVAAPTLCPWAFLSSTVTGLAAAQAEPAPKKPAMMTILEVGLLKIDMQPVYSISARLAQAGSRLRYHLADMRPVWTVAFLLVGTLAFAQPPAATVKQLMVDLIYPASNDILLFVYRGAPKDEREWAAVRRSALTLSESGNLLTMRGREGEWMKDAKMLADAGTAAYKAAQQKDTKALAALTEALDASCTACHKQYRFPREGGSK
jgi:hypothetical protein